MATRHGEIICRGNLFAAWQGKKCVQGILLQKKLSISFVK